MSRLPAIVFLFLCPVIALAQQESCLRYFSKDIQQILTSPQIAYDPVLQSVLTSITSSDQTPDVKIKMITCAYIWHNSPTSNFSSSNPIPNTFSPSVTRDAAPMPPVTSPSVIPMRNAAPGQISQMGDTVQQMGDTMMAIGNKIQNEIQNELARTQAIASANAAVVVARADLDSEQEIDSPAKVQHLGENGLGFIKTCSHLPDSDPNRPPNTYSEIVCETFVIGVSTGLSMYPSALKFEKNKKAKPVLCIGGNTSPITLVNTVLDYIHMYPTVKDNKTANVVAAALLLKYPCK